MFSTDFIFRQQENLVDNNPFKATLIYWFLHCNKKKVFYQKNGLRVCICIQHVLKISYSTDFYKLKRIKSEYRLFFSQGRKLKLDEDIEHSTYLLTSMELFPIVLTYISLWRGEKWTKYIRQSWWESSVNFIIRKALNQSQTF